MTEPSDEKDIDRISTVEFFLELAGASERWVARIRGVYMWVSCALMLFFSLLVGIYIPLLAGRVIPVFWAQFLLAALLILPPAAVWYVFLRRFDRETRDWQSRIQRLRNREAEMARLLEDKEG
jgi:membrane protein implicated in regulation of membrane protease activity